MGDALVISSTCEHLSCVSPQLSAAWGRRTMSLLKRGPRWRRLLSLDLFRSLSKETHLQKPVDVGITTLLALLLGFM